MGLVLPYLKEYMVCNGTARKQGFREDLDTMVGMN